MKRTEEHWHLIDWDGNPDLHYKCYRKKFGRGHVSVGVGDFTLIVYSYGPNSDYSMSSTRNRGTFTWTPAQAMAAVDAHNGKCN